MTISEKSSDETLETNDSLDSSAAGAQAFEPCEVNNAKILGDIPDHVRNLKFSLGYGKNRKDKRWPPKAMTYKDLIVGLSNHKVGEKDGQAFIQGTAIGNERKVPAIDALYIMGLDVDSGIWPQQVIERLQRMGLSAVIYTTHSHMKTDTFLVESSFNQWCKREKIEHAINEAPLEYVKRYLREARFWEQWIVDTVEVGEVGHTSEGKGWWLSHSPMPKFRAIFPLSSPYVIAKQHMSQKDAIDLWKRKLVGLANMLDLPLDQACLDASRLFYLPRHAEGAEFGVWVTGGEALVFEDIPEGQTRGSQSRGQNQSDPIAHAAAGLSREKRPHIKSADEKFDYSVWVATNKMSENFDIASLFRNAAPGQVRNEQSSTKLTVTCPFDHAHSNAGDPEDQGCYVESPDPATGINSFVFSCSHNSCKGRDRLEMLRSAIEDDGNGWFTADDLQDRDYHLGLTADAPVTTEEALERLTKEIEEFVTPNTADSVLDSFFEKLAALDTSVNQREAIIDRIAEKMGVTKAGPRRTIAARLTPIYKDAQARRDGMKAVAAKEKEREARAKKGGKPQLSVDDQGFMPCVEAAFVRMEEINGETPRYFDMGGQKVVIRKDERKGIETVPLDKDELLSELDHICDWVDGDLTSVFCHPRIASDIIHYPERKLPHVERISTTPFFTEDGELVASDGYHAASGVFCALPAELADLSVPPNPTREEVDDAVSLFFDDLLVDFPFNDRNGTGDASKANALAMALERYVRAMIRGPLPLYVWEKPQAGTGGSLGAEAVMTSVLGKPPAGRSQKTDETELRKEFTSFLMTGAAFYYVDNVRHKIEGGVWASKITLPEWEDRILGASRNASFPNHNSTVVTGNKIRMSDELSRRSVFIRLATKGDPKKRDPKSFKHPQLIQWTLDNRPRLVKAALTIIQAWIAADKPAPQHVPHFASFESYAHVLGGILENADVKGFLGNMRIAKESAFDDKHVERDLCRKWFERWGQAVREVGNPEKDLAIKDGQWQAVNKAKMSVITLIRDEGLDVPLNWEAPVKSQMTALGRWLKDNLEEEVITIAPGLDVCMEIIPEKDPRNLRSNSKVYRLECVGYDPREADQSARRLWSQWAFDWKGAASELVLEWGNLPDWTDAGEAEADKLQRQAAR